MIDRHSAESAREKVVRFFPDPGTRKTVLEVFATVVETVHAIAPAGWSVTLHGKIVINVGTWNSFGLGPASVWICLLGPEIPEDMASLLRTFAPRTSAFVLPVESLFGWIPAEHFVTNASRLEEETVKTARYFAERRKLAPWRESHSPGVLDYVSQVVGRQLPQPTFPPPAAGAADDENEYWKISPGAEGRLWPQWLEDGVASIGWDDLGDLTDVDRTTFVETRNRLKADNPTYTKAGAEQVWRFRDIPVGAYLVANRGTREILGLGRVTGRYFYDESATEHRHRLPVEWFDTSGRPADQPNWRKTLLELDRDEFEAIVGSSGATPPPQLSGPADSEPAPDALVPLYSRRDFAEDTGIEEATLRRWVSALERKGQAILYGPPGTGKTYSAERLARHLIGGTNGFCELVQFHPAYSYEEFMQGIRPRVTSVGGLEYPMMPGRFLDFIARARSTTGPAVLIIDEINRANLSRVFGELMYLLEYRDHAVPLAGGGTLAIPANVRIIGTMNTADRSIALVDHALRRRFAFLELPTNYDALVGYHSNGVGERIADVLREVNSTIEPHYRLGISYFLLRDVEQHLETIWRTEIEPYLEEYFFDRAELVDKYRWTAIRSRMLP